MNRTKPFTDSPAVWFCGAALALALGTSAAPLPSDWPAEQEFEVPASGLVKMSLPAETLDRARPALEDLRLYDSAGNELPYALERSVPASRISQRPSEFRVSLNPLTTIITIRTGLERPVESVTLDTAAASFIKAVDVSGSADGQSWQPLAQRLPIFRQPGGAVQLNVPIPAGVWAWLQLSIDDRRAPPIPFSGAVVHVTTGPPSPTEAVTVKIADRHENPGETRLTLNLGAANLDLAALELETPESLFTRTVTVAVPRVSEDSIREETLAQGTIYRVAIEGQPASASLSLRLDRQVRSPELLLLVENQDSPPLSLTSVRAERRPVYVVFLARQAGVHYLLTGNNRCPAPRYDLAALAASFKNAPVQSVRISTLRTNASYHAPEVLPGIQNEGVTLDTSAWRFRRPIALPGSGVQQVELDLQVLSGAAPDFRDLRLMRDGRQVPYILEHTSITRAVAPVVTPANDPKDPQLSRWLLKLPQPRLPLTRLTCSTSTPLFQRDATLAEDLSDERGESYRHALGSASWLRTPDHPGKVCSLTLESPPQREALVLEIRNGDNPPVQLENFQFYYPATRILFKANPGDELLLYYGNPVAGAPRYDLSLVAGQLLTADKSSASLGPETQLKKGRWRETQPGGRGGVVFWSVLGLVVVVLLAIISRLLPKSTAPAK